MENKKIYAVNLVYYTEENIPENGAIIFIISNKDITKLPRYIIQDNIFIQEEMERNDCEGIGNIYEIPKDEFYKEYSNVDLINL